MKQQIERLLIPNFRKDFCELFQFRVSSLFNWYFEFDAKFTIIINVLDRSNLKNLEQQQLVYAGVYKQRDVLKTQLKRLNSQILEDKETTAWDKLNQGIIPLEKSVEGGRLYDEFKNGELELDDIRIGSLKDYFKKYFVENEFDNDLQGHEYPILNHYFDITKDKFISLPLIQFGNFDGVVHIVFEEKLEYFFKQKKNKKYLIKQLSLGFESLLIDFELVLENISKNSQLKAEIEHLKTKEYYEKNNRNPILRELNYRQYYIDSGFYLDTRIEQNDEVPLRIKTEHRKRAIIAILIDSFAHNISAHSLTVLNWWFKLRAAKVRTSPIFQQDANKLDDLANQTQSVIGFFSSIADDNENALSKYKAPLAPELQPLFKFLLEKGAFWSGVSRGTTFSGETLSLYEVLWYGFINNSLYLGTIANSENVNKINLHLSFFESKEQTTDKQFYNIKTYRKEDNIILDGLFAQIDLNNPILGKKAVDGQSAFVSLSPNFHIFKAALEKIEAFFPGSVIGMHAFYTLLENEIRNVKHYRGDVLKNIQENGLSLNISIHQHYVNTTSTVHQGTAEMYKIGVWLKHPVELNNDLVVRRLRGLEKDIITKDTQQPKLGGSFQDKICAAMLMNNDFTKVQQGSEEEDFRSNEQEKTYYPWIKAASSIIANNDENGQEDFEISGRKYRELGDNLKSDVQEGTGYLKKYFHLWKGDYMLNVSPQHNWDWENLARFKFINIAQKDEVAFDKARKAGVIRILENQATGISKENVYKNWLAKWLKEEDEAIRIILQQGKTEIGHIIYDIIDGAKYFTKIAYTKDIAGEYDGYQEYPISFEHSSKAEEEKDATNFVFNIRSYGVLATQFFKDIKGIEDFENTSIEPLKLYELTEVLQTKIAIFDNRIAARIENEERRKQLNQTLRCGIYSENETIWKGVKENLAQYHFLILHLSFIEAMKDAKGDQYGEKRIADFIKNEIVSNLPDGIDNFILVITTGRGRTQWWENIKDTNYSKFTTFRPIESLIEAVEKASLKKDDINLKYNVIKTLFGS